VRAAYLSIAHEAVQALFVDFDVEAALSLLALDYIEHNPAIPMGAALLLHFLPFLQESGLSIEVHQTVVKGNLVVYHIIYSNVDLIGAPMLVGFDVFRVEHSQIQEHWDNLRVLQGPNSNGNSMVGHQVQSYRNQRGYCL
jgi:predicted SnoaL-like aldol condensation-catalyzing enzyme